MERIPVPPKGDESRRPDLTVGKARNLREHMHAILNEAGVYPRPGSDIDTISLALYRRMAELHESICILVERGCRRDAVILGRTLLEAQITYYWLTNNDLATRFNRYLMFAAQVRLLGIKRLNEFYELAEPIDHGLNPEIIHEVEALFDENATQWNEKNLYQMASDPDEHDDPEKENRPNYAQYKLFYFWFSLLSHPSAEAIKNFLPILKAPYSTNQPPDPHAWQKTPWSS